MNNQSDLLQIKIEKAKEKLSKNTRTAIDSVDWQTVILKMRETKGYSFEQLGSLELETELLLSGLISSTDYSKKLEESMDIPKTQVDLLVSEMNELVFSKIKEKFIQITEKEKQEPRNTIPLKPSNKNMGINLQNETDILNKAGIEIIKSTHPNNDSEAREPDLSIPELNAGDETRGETIKPILEQKLGGLVKSSTVKTEHSLNNLSKNSSDSSKVETEKKDKKTYPPKTDPYREIPE